MDLPIAMFILKGPKMPLLFVLQNNRSSRKSGLSKAVVDTGSVHNPTGKCVNEVKPIGRVARLQSPGLAGTVKPNTLIVSKTAKDWRLCIAGMIAKYPNYVFVAKVKSGELGRIKYWFKDTKTNVTKVYSYKDMEHEIYLATINGVRTKEKGFEPIHIEPEDYIPNYCIIDNLDTIALRKVQYDMYKIRKYNTLLPFATKFTKLQDKLEKFNYKEDKIHVTESEVAEPKEVQEKILGETGTGFKIVNGFIVFIKSSN